MQTVMHPNPAEIRNVDNCPNLCPVFFERNEHWEYVKNGKLKGLKGTVKENTSIETIPENWKIYPLNWSKGNSLIFEVQAEYYQQEDEEGNKTWGYCRTLYFFNTATPRNIALKIANGTHPVKLAYNLLKPYL